MQREPHQNVATVLVDPAVQRELELDLMARDLWLWPVAPRRSASTARARPSRSAAG